MKAGETLKQGRMARLAWVALPLMAVLIAGLGMADLRTSYESQTLLLVLNLVFTTLVAVFITVLAAKSFLRNGQLGLLMLGCAMLIWGASAFVASVQGHIGNFNITIHNLGVWCSAGCHLAGASTTRRTVNSPGGWLAGFYSGALIVVGLIWLAMLEQWLPVFFVQGVGGTPVRHFVLITTIAMLTLAATIIWTRHRRAPSAFLSMYAVGLALLAVGATGLMIQLVHGGLLSWAGRAAQYLGGLYMLVGSVIAVRKSNTWELPLAVALEVAKDQYQLLFESSNDGIVLHELMGEGRSGRFVQANNAICTLLGYTRPEILERNAWDICSPEDHAGMAAEVVAMKRDGVLVHEKTLIGKNGRRIEAEINTRLFEHRGRPMVLSVIRDVSERRQRERQLTEHARLLDLSNDNIFVRDGNGRITYWNQGAEQTYGYSRQEALGRVAHELLQTRFPEPLEAITAKLESELRWSGELIHTRRDGNTITVASRWALDRDAAGRPASILETNNDITAQKAGQEQLRRVAEEAEAASRAKDDFLAALSHELRTPLSPVLLCAAALENDPKLPAELREQLAMMRRNIQLEVQLIDDLLDLTRISRGKLVLHPKVIDLHELLVHTEQIVRSDGQARGITMCLTLEAAQNHCTADPARLQQVLWNLLKNAIKFTNAGGRVVVSTSNPRPGKIAVRIEDTGIGISAAALERIFGAFDQGELGGRHQFGGLGLGLSISRAIVNLHAGELSAASEGPGKGSVFTVELDVVGQPAMASRLEGAQPAPIESLRILLVEDHENTLSVLTRLFEREGHMVFGARSVYEALQMAAIHPCDILISDLGLPDGTGYELMQEIRSRYRWPGIALSGFGMEADMRASADAGFSAHLVKPVDFAQLRTVIASTLAATQGAP